MVRRKSLQISLLSFKLISDALTYEMPHRSLVWHMRRFASFRMRLLFQLGGYS